jgi:hypothetical protein
MWDLSMSDGVGASVGCKLLILPRLFARSRLVVTSGVTAVCAACAPQAPPLTRPEASTGVTRLELLAEAVIPTSARFPALGGGENAFGSLSGLARDEASGQYVAVNDDRIDARVAWLEVRFVSGVLTVTPTRIDQLTAAGTVDPRRVTAADLEAITALPDGTFVVVEEGHVVTTGRRGASGVWPPALLTLTRDARVTRITEFPPMFAVEASPAARRGIRDNQGFESLTRTPDGRLIAGLEQPRFADGDPPQADRGARSRLVEFLSEGGAFRPGRQWIYELSPTPFLAGYDQVCDDGENGLTDLLALDASRLLALERSCARSTATSVARNAVRLYEVDVREADDVSSLDSLIGAAARRARKQLVLDFETLIPRLSSELSGLENFEAIAFGPPAPDGGRTLLVMSDNNFRETQKTAFLLFALR